MNRTHAERVRIFEENVRLVGWCLRRYPPRVAPYDDVRQEMLVLLWRLTATWDPNRCTLSTYADRSLRHAESIVRQRGGAAARRTIAFSNLPGSSDRDAHRIWASVGDRAGGSSRNDVQVQGLLTGPDTVAEVADREERAAAPRRVEAMLLAANLAPQSREVLRLRYLQGLTLRQAGERLGLTHQRVQQIESRALVRLRQRAELGGL